MAMTERDYIDATNLGYTRAALGVLHHYTHDNLKHDKLANEATKALAKLREALEHRVETIG